MFQSTHPHGVRHGGFYRLKPTPRVSIHAPTWGATELPEEFVNYMTVSIHAPTWGATMPCLYVYTLTNVSIHAPTWGATSIWSIRTE